MRRGYETVGRAGAAVAPVESSRALKVELLWIHEILDNRPITPEGSRVVRTKDGILRI